MQSEIAVTKIHKIAVIGAGRAGRRFALRCAQANYSVVLEDVMPANLRQAEAEFADLSLSGVEFALTVEDAVWEADIAIDFVPDELESKLEIFSLMDRMAPPRTIFCTPSEALSITDLASCTYRGERCVAVRGDLGSGVEVRVLHPDRASMHVISQVSELFESLRFQISVERDPDIPTLMKNLRLV